MDTGLPKRGVATYNAPLMEGRMCVIVTVGRKDYRSMVEKTLYVCMVDYLKENGFVGHIKNVRESYRRVFNSRRGVSAKQRLILWQQSHRPTPAACASFTKKGFVWGKQ